MSEKTAYAVIKTGGKQYRVTTGESISIERLEGNVGDVVTFSEVLLRGEGASVQVGSPTVTGATVKAKIVAQDRAQKVVIFKKRRRKGYTKKQGHRQDISTVVIESVA
jgi:large subunit ribosomal protein L21